MLRLRLYPNTQIVLKAKDQRVVLRYDPVYGQKFLVVHQFLGATIYVPLQKGLAAVLLIAGKSTLVYSISSGPSYACLAFKAPWSVQISREERGAKYPLPAEASGRMPHDLNTL